MYPPFAHFYCTSLLPVSMVNQCYLLIFSNYFQKRAGWFARGLKEKGWDNTSWWKNKCHDRWSIPCFLRINAWKEKGQWKVSCRVTTNLACRILHRPFHSIACSSPRFYKDCKCQHTSRQSEKWQGRERGSEDDLWAANAPQAQGAIRPASRPHGTRPVFIEASLTCLFRKTALIHHGTKPFRTPTL